MPLTTFLAVAALALLFGVLLGILIGSHLLTWQQTRRHDELAKRMKELRDLKRRINAKLRTLRAFRQAEHSPRTDAPD